MSSGNLVTDAMVDYVRVLDRWKNLSIAFINGGSLRASLQEGGWFNMDVVMMIIIISSSIIILNAIVHI